MVNIFISYVHESKEIENRVFYTSQKLRSDGINCIIDQYIDGTPEIGWAQWTEEQIANSDYVLILCTEEYYQQFGIRTDDNKRKGSAWECMVIINELYKRKSVNKKYIPMVISPTDALYIPTVLSQYTYYSLQDDYHKLYAFLTKQSRIKPEPLGEIKRLKDDAFESSIFLDNSIINLYESFNKEINRLTCEQFNILRMLKNYPQMKISGCAGSGKTLVAMEQSIRIAKKGNRTLLLCHNPILNDNFKKAVTAYGVNALSFTEWCSKIIESELVEEKEWTQFSEPTDDDVTKAISISMAKKEKYDAIIVDEGQDFKRLWWDLVVCSLKDRTESTFYIFYDENQSLLSDRCVYDGIGGPIDLSKNCRNAGDIYKLISSFHRQAPDPEVNLLNMGSVELCLYAYETVFSDVSCSLNRLENSKALDNAVLLLGNNKRVNDHWMVLNNDIYLNSDIRWQECVKRIFLKVCHRQEHVVKISGAEKYINEKLNELSDESYPDKNDIELVKSFAKYFPIPNSISKRILDGNKIFRNGLRFYYKDGNINLGRPGPRIWDAEYIMHFQNDAWTDGIPKPKKLSFVPYYSEDSRNGIKVYNTGTFKGLEADSVILLIENRETNARRGNIRCFIAGKVKLGNTM